MVTEPELAATNASSMSWTSLYEFRGMGVSAPS